MNDALTGGSDGLSGGSCPYCGNWHQYSYDCCKAMYEGKSKVVGLNNGCTNEIERLQAENARLTLSLQSMTEHHEAQQRDWEAERERLRELVDGAEDIIIIPYVRKERKNDWLAKAGEILRGKPCS